MAGALALAVAGATAHAQAPTWEKPKKPEEVAKAVEWDAQAQAGVIITTGNSETTTLSAGAKAARKEGLNKFQAAVAGAFARSSLYIATDANGDGAIQESEIERPTQTTTRMWELMARYDRFLTEHNSLYLLGKLSADQPAGKELVAGGQAGYSRQLYKDAIHELVGEVGYDFSYEKFEAGNDISIHSGRAFAGYKGKLSADTSVNASGEILVNVNKLDAPGGEVDRFEDTRLTGVLEMTTKLYENISFNFGFTAKYDNAPAPLPPFSLPYADGFVPLADELDTITKASLIINFL
jgi:hypothetical protein